MLRFKFVDLYVVKNFVSERFFRISYPNLVTNIAIFDFFKKQVSKTQKMLLFSQVWSNLAV